MTLPVEVAEIAKITTVTQLDGHDMLLDIDHDSKGSVLIHFVDEPEDSFYPDLRERL